MDRGLTTVKLSADFLMDIDLGDQIITARAEIHNFAGYHYEVEKDNSSQRLCLAETSGDFAAQLIEAKFTGAIEVFYENDRRVVALMTNLPLRNIWRKISQANNVGNILRKYFNGGTEHLYMILFEEPTNDPNGNTQLAQLDSDLCEDILSNLKGIIADKEITVIIK